MTAYLQSLTRALFRPVTSAQVQPVALAAPVVDTYAVAWAQHVARWGDADEDLFADGWMCNPAGGDGEYYCIGVIKITGD